MRDYKGLHSLHKFPVCWRNMLARCYNKNSNRYSTYGGRGIIVCDKWHTFSNFHFDMWEIWAPNKTLDRIDLNGPYSKENCAWVSPKENSQKRTSSKLTAEQVAEIRKLFAPGLAYQERLAKTYGVSSRMIRYIGSGDAW